jgi:hypothetical protein
VAYTEKAQDADFEAALEFERRVQDMAEPRSEPSTPGPARVQSDRGARRSAVLSGTQRVLKKG